MKSLIVEDDFVSRLLTQRFLTPFGECHIAANGKEALAAFETAIAASDPYHLVCLDIMMPEMDGQATLRELRLIEEKYGLLVGDGVKVIMTTALSDMNSKIAAFNGACDAYLVKPVDRSKLLSQLRDFKLID
jgi:two-component system, chemotaxis family, chemotaxis protein CheY